MRIAPTDPPKRAYSSRGGAYLPSEALASDKWMQRPPHIDSSPSRGEERRASRNENKRTPLSLVQGRREEDRTLMRFAEVRETLTGPAMVRGSMRERGFPLSQRLAAGVLGVVLLLGMFPSNSVAQIEAIHRMQREEEARRSADNAIRQVQQAEASRQIQTTRPVERLEQRSIQNIDGMGAIREAERINLERTNLERINAIRDAERINTERINAVRTNVERVEATRRAEQLNRERVEATCRAELLTTEKCQHLEQLKIQGLE